MRDNHDSDLARLMPGLFRDLQLASPEEEIIVDSRGTKNGKRTKRTGETEGELYDKHGFDIYEYMDNSIDKLTGTVVDLRIDDRDLPLAKNYYDFCFGGYLGPDVNPPWSRQLLIMLLLFGEICFYCTDTRFKKLAEIPKDFPAADLTEHLTLLEHGRCPCCGTTKTWLYNNHYLELYNELCLVWGQRSGKSETAVAGTAYITHRMLKLPKLSTMSNLFQASTPMVATFVSLTFGKAYDLLWVPFREKVLNIKWFKQYHSMLDHYGNQYGEELYAIKKEFLTYGHKNIRIHPAHPNGANLRGDTRWLCLMDELGLFRILEAGEEEVSDKPNARANADEAHTSLVNSLATIQAVMDDLLFNKRMYHVPSVYMIGVSSPVSERDKVMRILADSRGEGCHDILGSQMPTWEINPGLERTSPIIAKKYRENFVKAERDFGARPASSAAPWFTEAQALKMFVGARNAGEIIPVTTIPEHIYGVYKSLQGHSGAPSIMTLDAGLTNNSFSLAISYRDGHRIVFPVLLELFPLPERRIHFNQVYLNIMLPLAKAFNVAYVSADRWNSADLLSRIIDDMGKLPGGKADKVKAAPYMLRPRDFDDFETAVSSGNIILPSMSVEDKLLACSTVLDYKASMKGKPVAHALLQLRTVQRFSKEESPSKGPGYTDDILRTIVLGADRHNDLKVAEYMRKCLDTHKVAASAGPSLPVVLGRGGY